jgi:acetyltransferase-like isoleucine patch superfamily enzyme
MSDKDQLRAALGQLYEDLRADVRSRWQRDLPLEELLFDRWERAASLGFGEGTSIYHSSYVFGDVSVGSNTWIGPFVLLDGTGGLTIGDNCSISSGVQIYSHDTVKWAVSGGTAPYEHAPVSIGNSCYIGSQSVVAKGITIGDHCVVGACSFVNRDLVPSSIAGGVPIRRLGHVELSDGEAELVIDPERP